jgi:hypothetical protein
VASILIAVLIVPWACPSTLAQTDTVFSPADKFSIPASNGTISFAVNGTYANATLENGVWNFTDLRLNGSQPLESFEVSAQNSNVTIFSYLTFSATIRGALLSYAVKGQGKQTIDIGIDSKKDGRNANAEWSVIFNGALRGEGDGWSITPDSTLIINDAVGNVTILYYGFLYSIGDNSNLPFYQQHSVVIITVVAVAITIIIAIAIRVKNRKHSD